MAKTALVTGASAGLGELFAHRLARDGYDLVLVARNEGRLHALVERLRLHKVSSHVVAMNLATPGAAQQLFAETQRRSLSIDVLINNAGFGAVGRFLELELATAVEMINLNCSTLLQLAYLYGNEMRQRGHGRILNVASTAGFLPCPYKATYYATKAFVLSLSEALAEELTGTGVTVTCSCPGPTLTEFAQRSGNTRPLRHAMRAEPVVEQAYEAMLNGEALVVHGWLNWVASTALRLSPRAAVRSLMASLNQPSQAR